MPKRNLPETVQEKLKLLPGSPGCYIYKDEQGHVLYVGKAISLKNRVRSYFQESARHGTRIARLVSKVREIEWIVVDSEVEALVLECNLIKQHRPPYNVRLRDDKTYPYITITKEKFPRVMFTRRVRRDGAKYFGPYTSAFAVRDTLQLLHKVFPLIPCGKSWRGEPDQKPCLYYHLGRCLGPCAGLADREQYGQVLEKVERFLNGKEESIVEDLKRDMAAAAEDLDFEKAAKMRDQIQAIETVMQRQKVLVGEQIDQDVIAVVKDERGSAIQMLYIRGGKLIGQRQYVLDGSADAAPQEAVQEFVKQYYADAPEVPREILLPVEIEERNIVQAWLRQRKGSAVTVEVPQTGEKARLVDMAAANAEQALAAFSQELQKKEAWAEEAMGQLQDSLGLPTPPLRVEGYDISNIQGTAPVGSMVVTENGEGAKAEYRRFKIRYHPESPNDFAMMHEVLTRRLKAYVDGDEKFQKLPDLIMIDGGKGQLAAALKARDELGLTVPMVGLAKRHELIYVPIEPVGELLEDIREMREKVGVAALGSSGVAEQSGPNTEAPQHPDTEYSYSRPAPKLYTYREVELPLNSPGLMLLRKLRDEAHRFALTYHRKVRDKRMGASALEEIPGVGPRRKRLLLRTFGSLEGIRRASAEEIAAVPTMTKTLAEKVREYLQET
jgi:excinuclease ABC subunit C